MKSGIASETAAIVCMARAIAHGRTVVAFSDPTAIALLSRGQQAEVERIRLGKPPKEWRARIRYEHLMKESQLMVARTVAIDACFLGIVLHYRVHGSVKKRQSVRQFGSMMWRI